MNHSEGPISNKETPEERLASIQKELPDIVRKIDFYQKEINMLHKIRLTMNPCQWSKLLEQSVASLNVWKRRYTDLEDEKLLLKMKIL
jgi:hypothetical protein